MRNKFILAAAWLLLAGIVTAADAERTVTKASDVLNEVMSGQMTKIPEALLANAEAVAVFPGVVKVGFVAGVERGHGVVVIRGEDRNWQAPRFVTVTGGSVGWQIGASATDLILVFKTRKSVENLLTGKFKIGADIAAAAGPVGRRAEAATDGQLQAEIYSYSRSRGLFAGVSIDGAMIQLDGDSERDYYRVGPDGQVVYPESGGKFIGLVDTYSKQSPTEAENQAGNPAGNQAGNVPGQVRLLTPEEQLENLRANAAGASEQLARIVDESWRRYFALPAEAYAPGGKPSAASVAASLAQYDQVLRNPQYARIVERGEFQAARNAVAAYAQALSQQTSTIVPLPPPPAQR